MAAEFASFTSLSAELRATIWSLALLQEHESRQCMERQIELYNHNPETESISAAISRPYPTLFAVSREPRYEAAKAMKCRWVPVHSHYDSSTEPDETNAFEVCINPSLDTINLRTRFFTPLLQPLSTACPTPEEHRLEALSRLLGYDTLQCIERIAIDAQPPPAPCRLDFNAWWKGEGLEIFCYGRLEHVIISTRERPEHSSKDYSRWLKAAVKDEVHDRWTERGQTDKPDVEVLNVWQ